MWALTQLLHARGILAGQWELVQCGLVSPRVLHTGSPLAGAGAGAGMSGVLHDEVA